MPKKKALAMEKSSLGTEEMTRGLEKSTLGRQIRLGGSEAREPHAGAGNGWGCRNTYLLGREFPACCIIWHEASHVLKSSIMDNSDIEGKSDIAQVRVESHKP